MTAFASRYIAFASLVAVSALGTSAQGQTTVYSGYDRNTSSSPAAPSNPNSDAASSQFQASLNGTSTESFEGFPVGAAAPLTLSFTGSAGTLSATLSGSGSVQSATRAAPTSSGQFATDGSHYYLVDSSSFSISFGSAVAAFGFYATDIESDVQLIFSHATGPSETYAFSTIFPLAGYSDPAQVAAGSGSVNFLGFINTANPFTGVTFGQGPNSSGDLLAFDQMTIGDARQVVTQSNVPEPASWALMAGGFGLLGAAMRNRRTGDCSILISR